LPQRIALHRSELRAWAMYNWANSAMVTTIKMMTVQIEVPEEVFPALRQSPDEFTGEM